MGLLVHNLAEIASAPDVGRRLYIYLLDYGWPEGPYEKIFHDNWSKLAERASQTDSIIIRSPNGLHFANEVLNWHCVGGHDAEEILPAILMTHTPPSYFSEGATESSKSIFSDPLTGSNDADLGDVAILPLKQMCASPQKFLDSIESIFSDLEKGLRLREFRTAKFDIVKPPKLGAVEWIKTRVGRAILLQPNVGGLGIDLQKFFAKEDI